MRTTTPQTEALQSPSEYLAEMISIHGGRVTLPIDSDDDQGSIIWFDSHAVAAGVSSRLGQMAELFDCDAVYIHPEHSDSLLSTFSEGA